MYFFRTVCDLYIGTGAGKKLMADISNAKRSVKIVSPFLSPSLVKKLIDLHFKGIDVQLVTMDSIKDFYGAGQRILHQIVIQDRTIDLKIKALRAKWKKGKRLSRYAFIIITMLLCALAIWKQDRIFLWGMLPSLPLLALGRHYMAKIANARIYRYSYRSLFQLKVFTDSISYSHPYIHGKIYLIDDDIAYLGSLNFTANGTKNNYETRIRITDPRAVKEMVNEFENLIQSDNLPDMGMNEWGRELYDEPGD